MPMCPCGRCRRATPLPVQHTETAEVPEAAEPAEAIRAVAPIQGMEASHFPEPVTRRWRRPEAEDVSSLSALLQRQTELLLEIRNLLTQQVHQ